MTISEDNIHDLGRRYEDAARDRDEARKRFDDYEEKLVALDTAIEQLEALRACVETHAVDAESDWEEAREYALERKEAYEAACKEDERRQDARDRYTDHKGAK